MVIPRLNERLRAIYITDPRLEADAQERVVVAVLEGGFRAVQVRLPGATARELYELAKRLQPAIKRVEGLLLVNDRIDVAQAVGADGVHLGRRSLPIQAARRIGGTRGFIIGFSAHDMEELHLAAQQGANYCSLSPVFAPNSKVASRPPLGVERFRKMARAAHLPVIALGGIEPDTVGEMRRAGAAGVSLIGALSRTGDARMAAQRVIESLAETASQAEPS